MAGRMQDTGKKRGVASALARHLLSRFPRVEEALIKAYPLEQPERYLTRNLLMTALFGLVFGGLMGFLLRSAREFSTVRAIAGGLAIGVLVWFLLYLLMLLILPHVKAGKRAESIEKNLLFALRELRLLVKGGHPVHDAMLKLSKAGYGELSREFELLVRDIEANIPLKTAMAGAKSRNPSEAFGRTLSMLNSALVSGSSLSKSLDAAIRSLDAEQKASIRSYAKELNLWSLLYLLFAVAIPTIGAVLILVLSAFVGGAMSTTSYLLLIVACFCVQAGIIGFVKSRRPIGV